MAQDFFSVSYLLPDPGADDLQIKVFKAPSDVNGGGVTLLDADIVCSSTATHSLGVGGTTFTVALHRFSTAYAVNGTITDALGGTDVGWGAEVPQQFTVDSSYNFIDAGEYVVLDYQEINAGNPPAPGAQLTMNFVRGK